MDLALERKAVVRQAEDESLVYPARFYQLELDTARMLCELNIRMPQEKNGVLKNCRLSKKEPGWNWT